MYLTDEKVGPWTWIGEVGVDSGHLVLADPCYLSGPRVERLAQVPVSTWHQEGLILLVPAGFGDGLYPVEARFVADVDETKRLGREVRRVAEVRVVFIQEEREEDDGAA